MPRSRGRVCGNSRRINQGLACLARSNAARALAAVAAPNDVATCDLGNTIWWHHALRWTLAQAFYDFVLYVIAGLVLAKFVTPKATAPVA